MNLLLGLGGQELMLRLVWRLLRGMALLLCAGFGHGVLWPALVLRLSVLARYYVDEEVEHVGLAECGCNVAALESATFVFFGVDPGAHGELGDKGLASLGEYDGRFGRDHLNFWVRLHDLLDARKRELVDLVVVVLRLEHRHDLLPVGVQDVAVVARAEALGDLNRDASVKVFDAKIMRNIEDQVLTLPQWPLKVSGGGAWPWAAMPALAP